MNHIYRSIWSDALGTWIAVSEQCKSKGKSKCSRTVLLMTGLLLASPSGWSLPTGDQLVAGQASVSTPNANTLQINQASQNAIINWQGFSVGQNQAVNILQPNTQAALLNRVIGQDASQIQGQINANGQVYLVNPNGVLFSKTAQVDVGGLVATTHDIKNQDFMNGKNHFTQNGATGKVENHGTINAKSGGVVALIGSSVTNTGNINTPNGTTALAAGKTVDLDFQGNGLIEVKVSEAALNAQITNKGAIIADGGRVMMSAKAAGQLIDTVINQDGIVKARGMIERNGEIILDGGDNGAVKVSGTLDASTVGWAEVRSPSSANDGLPSSAHPTTGGNIKVTGKDVQINNGAIVTASGNTGGGNISIGDKHNTQQTTITEGATVSTQALNSGTAGTINVLANMDTGTVKVAGTLDASAPKSGNGGFIDTSAAHVKTTDTTKVSTQAANGKTGTWLIDPNDFIIGVGGDITGTTLANNLATSDVIINSTQGATTTGNGDIFVNEAVSYSSANSLTLNALRSINVNSPINNAGTGSVNLRADFLGACVTGATNCGTVNFQGAGSITANTVNIYYNPVSIGVPTDYSSFVIGTLNAYMLINDVNQLQAINSYPSGTYALGKDIDASATSTWNSGAGFIPINDIEIGFRGVFDGLNHTITGLIINRPTFSSVGLFGGVESEGIIRNVGLIGGSVIGSNDVGSLVGYNSGSINNVYAKVNVTGSNNNVGGLVGYNQGTLSNAYATGNVAGSNNVGGLAGFSSGFFSSTAGSISTAYATGNVTGNNNVGGLIGQSGASSIGGAASIDNVYATGNVNGTSYVGGLVGINTNMPINNAYAMGRVIGTSNVGGLAGSNGGTISNSFWNTQTTAQSIGVGQGNTTGVTGKTTAQMQQLATFSSAGWSIVNTGGSSAIWRIYEGNTAPLLSYWLKPLTINANVTETYNGLIHNSLANASFSIPNALNSGNLFSNDPFFGASAVNVGIYPLTTNLYSNQQGFNISSFGSLEITPANLTITANNASKTYGQQLNFAGTEFVSSGLQNGETIGSVNLASTGAIATASVAGNPYTITASNPTGGTFSASNYAITFNDGLLTVDPAALSITANNASKTYGQLLNFLGTEFISSGLQNGETIGSVTLASAGVSASAPVAGNPYAITATNPVGGTFNTGNYTITFNNGALTVNPAALSINANNASKTYGQLLNFLGTEFISSGLQNGETIGSVNLASAGAIATAPVAGNPYTITASNPTGGTFNASNYAITFNNGLLSVNPAALSITANNLSKIYGQLLNFTGTEFVSSGLQNGETIDSVTLASAGVSATAPVTDNPYTITATNPTGGTFSASNYAITFNNGLLSVNPAALSITANNASKIFGQTLNFTGTEFISSGLQNGETIGSVTLASLGAVATASVEGSPYTITPSNAAGGTFSPSNYTITYNDGLLTINPVALRITDQSNATLQDNIVGLVGRNFNAINWFNNTNSETDEPEADLVRIDDNSDNFTGYPSNNLFRLIDLARDDKKRIVPKLKYKNSAGRVKVLHVSDDGQYLSLLLEDGTVRVWDLERGVQRNIVDPKQTQTLTDIGEVNDKGELLSIAGTTGIGTYDIIGAINEDRLSIKGRDVNHFANSSDGNLLLVNLGTNNMRLWDNAQRRELWQLQSQRGEVKDLIMSDDKLRAAVLTRQEGVYAYDAKLGKLKQITDAIDIIDMKTGKIITSLPNVLDQVVYLSFKDKDTLQVGLANGELQNWSLSSRSKKSTSILVEKLKTVDNLGETYAYTTTTGIARVGDAQGNVQLSIENKENLITDARLLAKGEKLLTVFETGDLALWDIASGKKMLRLFSSKQGGWTVMDAFGRFDGSEDAMENFDWIAENDTIPLDSFSENYYEPGLLATILQEQDYFNNDSSRIIDGISLPPKVDLQLAAQQAGNDKVAVQLNVFDRGGGINKVNIYHNGKLINHDDLIVVPTNGEAEQRSLTLQLSPNAGKNTVKVVASNDLGIENSGTEISFDGKTKAYDSAMRLMSVGINKYSDRNLNLSYSVADAQLIEETLKNSGKLLASKILIDQHATKPHILAQLKELSQGAQQDVLIIYLAGHGVALGKEWYFLPHETKMQTNIEQTVNTGITATELSDIFKDSKIQHIFLMVDSCYSGAGMDAFNKLENGQRYLSRRLGRSLGITVVTAAAKNQEAAELKSLGHGVFTYLMAEEMQKQQTNEPITAHGIAQHISDTLPIISKQMTGTSQAPAIYIKGNNFTLRDVAKDKK